ncbi:ankyrin repeat domain-containing protein SOWAHC [Drosophila serrata]|uniref:ankyrin repeat domain-containing protein SOWAHC n=1 Tax=Drosophila serrata TaxID=7274 RepID=UPI000A1D25DB|nr:ankyrin repeat domain-containing protein SOWAHC [Drosophila serrata]
MELPKELSVAEIRNYMLANDCKVTNHALVKHFKKFLTHPQSQSEARKRFKTYVTLLSTIKNENNQKFLILRKKYVNECPSDEVAERAVAAASSAPEPSSPGGASLNFDSPMRQPPPYKNPPMVTSPPAPASAPAPAPPPPAPAVTGVTVNKEHQESYKDCVNEFTAAITRIDPRRLERQESTKAEDPEPIPQQATRSNSIDDALANKENIPRFSFSSGASTDSSSNEKPEVADETKPEGGGGGGGATGEAAENPMSVKEATRKFNRMASEEEAKIISPPAKKKPEKQLIEEKDSPEVTLSHPKAKEWIVSMAKANYQELAKMASEFPELVKLQCPATGYTALHWAAKHGNEDVVKLIAGTYKADVNARTNGGYTPLHLATQFGRDNIFELLWNVYKANRDIMDYSGNKPLDYSRQRPSVSASTCSKIKARKKHAIEKDLGFLRIGSLNVRVKKTTEAFSNFLGVGNGSGVAQMPYGGAPGTGAASHPHHRSRRAPHQRHHHHVGTTRNRHPNQRAAMSTPYATNGGGLPSRASAPNSHRNIYDGVHKSWGSADNITQRSEELMPPPKSVDYVSKQRNKSSKRSSYASNATDSPRDSICSSNSSSNLNGGYSSMPTTPNQMRAPKGIVPSFAADSDSDSACGFDSSWSVNCRNSSSSNPSQS